MLAGVCFNEDNAPQYIDEPCIVAESGDVSVAKNKQKLDTHRMRRRWRSRSGPPRMIFFMELSADGIVLTMNDDEQSTVFDYSLVQLRFAPGLP